ncbi:PH domain-containing protein [Acetanaerobacterium elongatum]|uniref:PH domain-containing protein n=1 Tax=Acetanaerobacterium elongatum TaxID=258515 RepID=A0A1G9UZ36_9FIRM|nr:PH domain-containing protein [Acetanaerobacterium elongatum]SDM65261.1 PH domain-containing protein [Acetanaerobacterium elongatum]
MSENKQAAEQEAVPVIKERKRWLFLGLPFTFTRYELDGKRLKLCRGFLNTTEDDLLLYRVMDVTVSRTLFQRMAGLGTMTIVSTDKTNPTLAVTNIKRVHAFKDALDARVESERMRMRFRAGEITETDFDGDMQTN